MMAASQIGKFACRVNLREGDIFIALRVHVDSSGKEKDRFMSIAAFAGNDKVWNEVEREWDKILKTHVPRANYVHMRELVRQINEFDRKKGWNPKNSFELVGKCLTYMSHVDKKRFRMFYCTIDLDDWRKLKAEGYVLPTPVEMCNEFCLYGIMWWYTQKYPHPNGVINFPADSAYYFFDKDEVFEEPFKKQWAKEKETYEATGELTPWVLIDQVSAADSKKVPGIQAADILAWSVNRENTADKNLPGRYLEIMKLVIPSGGRIWNEETMRKKYAKVLDSRHDANAKGKAAQ